MHILHLYHIRCAFFRSCPPHVWLSPHNQACVLPDEQLISFLFGRTCCESLRELHTNCVAQKQRRRRTALGILRALILACFIWHTAGLSSFSYLFFFTPQHCFACLCCAAPVGCLEQNISSSSRRGQRRSKAIEYLSRHRSVRVVLLIDIFHVFPYSQLLLLCIM